MSISLSTNSNELNISGQTVWFSLTKSTSKSKSPGSEFSCTITVNGREDEPMVSKERDLPRYSIESSIGERVSSFSVSF